MAAVTTRIEGLREVNRALSKVNRQVAKEVRDELKRAAGPVSEEAEALASGRIRNLGPAWGRMKVGSRSDSVFIAPRSRRRGGSPRPNLGGLLMRRAMIPAARSKRGEVERAVEEALDRLGRKAGF